ncbi:hypothetical protein [Bacillus sp. SG-1]|uniref:hypothetical protein n=1 Tax=Bacillus sp. SG-1 TaxID=161544 RepID=UPI00015437B5|nr:hypothetical protein [Bacillus sp. SG-1]EDL66716.1 hypothetical protein BSG1_05150 [Bacillus sp. SG-1]
MTPIVKYNFHLLIFFFSLMYLTFGQQLGLPNFLAPVLFIMMIFGFIISAVVGERFKKGIHPQFVLVSKMAWTLLYVLFVLTGGLVFGTISANTVQAVMPLAALYLAYALWKLRKNKVKTS